MCALVQKAVLLAAGRGTRLGRLTEDRPKPMIPVGGTPVLEWIIAGLRDAGITEFLVVVGYRQEAIRAHFGDGSKRQARITYAEQPVANGTGAALALAREFAGRDPVLCSLGDILTYPPHYRAILTEFERSRCAAVLGINYVDDPAAGAAIYREGDYVVRVVEKPPPGTSASCWNMAGVNVFGPAIFESLGQLRPSPRGEYELTTAIADLIARGHEVRACEFHGFWIDIGSAESLAEAEIVFSRLT